MERMEKQMLQQVQDIVAKYALIPLKIYDLKLNPITRWSCGTFLHWTLDVEDFPEVFRNPMPHLPRLPSILRKHIVEEELVRVTNQAKKQWEENPWKIHSFSVRWDDNLKFFVIPLVRSNKGLAKVKYIALAGPFYIGKRSQLREKLTELDNISRWERKILIEELSELPLFTEENDVRSKAKNVRGCLSAYVSYSEDFEGIPTEHLINDLYRFAEHREFWQRIARIILLDIFKGESIGVVISILPFSPEIEKKIYGFGYAYYSENPNIPVSVLGDKRPSREIYIYVDEKVADFYLNLNLESILLEDRPWDEIEKWIEDGSIKQSVLALELKAPVFEQNEARKIGSLFIFFADKQKKKKLKQYKDSFQWLTKAWAKEIEGIKDRTSRLKQLAENEFKEKQMELMKDLIAYTHITEREHLTRLLDSLCTTFGFKKLEYYMPAFYKGNSVFEKIMLPKEKFVKKEELYTELFENERPFIRRNGTFYIPIAIGDKAIAVVYGDTGSRETDEIKFDMVLRFSALLASKVLSRRRYETINRITKSLESLKLPQNGSSKELLLPKEGHKIAELIARFFGAHGCVFFIYDHKKRKFEVMGIAGEDIKNVFLRLNKTEFEFGELPFIESAWKNPYELKKWPDNHISCGVFNPENLEYKKGFAFANKSKRISVVLTLWTKLSKYDLSQEDKGVLRNFVNSLTGLVNIKAQEVYEKKLLDDVMTILLHEIGGPLSALRHSVEFASYILEKNPKEAKKILRGDAENFFERFLYILRSLKWTSKILRDEEIKLGGGPRPYKFWRDLVNMSLKRIFFASLKEKNLKLHVEYDKEHFPELMFMSEDQFFALTMIFFNLVINAIKYSYPGTVINLKGKVEGNKVKIFVENEGVGIIPQEKEEIFQKGKRGSNVKGMKGSGLGLFIAKKLAHALGGNVKLVRETNPTIFVVELPLKYFK